MCLIGNIKEKQGNDKQISGYMIFQCKEWKDMGKST